MNIYLMLGILTSCRTEKPTVGDNGSLGIVDADGDGFYNANDCDDTNPFVHPDMEERCDALDNDCDGDVDEGVILAFYADEDGDGFGDDSTEVLSCEQPPGYVTVANDCDDTNPDIYSGAKEVCNDIDDNCDGNIDEDLFSGLFYDSDGDGHGDPNTPSDNCSGGEGYVYYGDDCDDSNANIYPFAFEVCDGIDNNCDGDVDEGVTTTFWRDVDGDGFGDASFSVEECSIPEGFVANLDDCDDSDSLQYPGADEYCNEEDDDCDEDVDEDPFVSPTWYYDIDGDGFGSAFITVRECSPPPGYVDTDTDCDDTNTTVYPQATEYCDDLDNDCNEQIDDNAVDALYWYRDNDRDDFGDPNDVLYQCTQSFAYILDNTDCDDSSDEIYPGADELCNGVDEDCDGVIDNNSIEAFDYFLDSDGDGYGDPSSSIADCLIPAGYVENADDCDDTDMLIHPGANEDCDGIDQNCNGNTFYEQDIDGDGALACEASLWVRNHTGNPTNPNGNTSQAATILTNYGVGVSQVYLGNTTITASLLENYGVYVHHGRNTIGSLGAYSNAEANAISNWVYGGGRYLFMDFRNAEYPCEVADSLPAAFGITCNSSAPTWSGSTSTFEFHPITYGLSSVGGSGGQNWGASSAQVLIEINGNEFVMVQEYGEGKFVLVANDFPYRNTQSGYSIAFDDNQILVENIWEWLLD